MCLRDETCWIAKTEKATTRDEMHLSIDHAELCLPDVALGSGDDRPDRTCESRRFVCASDQRVM